MYPVIASFQHLRTTDHEKVHRKLVFIGGIIYNLRYADDTTLLAGDEMEVAKFLRHVEEASIDVA